MLTGSIVETGTHDQLIQNKGAIMLFIVNRRPVKTNVITRNQSKFQALIRKYQLLVEQSVSTSSEEVRSSNNLLVGCGLQPGLMATAGVGITWLTLAQTEEIVVAQENRTCRRCSWGQFQSME